MSALLQPEVARPLDSSGSGRIEEDHASTRDLSSLVPRFEDWGYAKALERGMCVAIDEPSQDYHLIVQAPWSLIHWNWAMSRLAIGSPQRRAQLKGYQIVSPDAFKAWLSTYEDRTPSQGNIGATGNASTLDHAYVEELSLASVDAQTEPIVRFVAAALLDALRSGASDVHLESDATGMQVKLRIDGVLLAGQRLDSVAGAEQVISRIKVLSQLDIAEQRVPQDGRMSVRYKGRSVDVRVSIMPCVHGEDAVLRVLDRDYLAQRIQGLTLDKLGFLPIDVQRFKVACHRPHGMVLVTGPTGSGKTTTLYAALTETRNEQEKVITIEDPVEYQLPGVLQIPVNERKGLSFSVGLRSILRHDPDRILVGEIRDSETARIAIQAALTGHVVYTTIHANGAFEVIHRLRQLHIDGYEAASALNVVLAQRLIRLLCVHCKRRGPDGTWHAVGCPQCRTTGYFGRAAIGELLVLDRSLKEAMARGASTTEMETLARAQGFKRLHEQAQYWVDQGHTSAQERDRMTASEERAR